ncbi:MAG: flippase-like domain-containing protein [Chitinispirillaceae bacterium]|nr:flippase-like domain-containing protein [Chitinispirillaceae bacterium]
MAINKLPRPVRILFKVAFTVLPFIWIFSRIDTGRIISSIAGVKWWTVPILFSMVIAAMLLQGVRWWVLLKASSPELNLSSAMGCHVRSVYYSLLLPTSTAQEVIRTVMISKKIGRLTSWSSAWLTKIMGIAVSIGFSIYGLTALSRAMNTGYANRIIAVSAVIVVALFGLSFSKRITRPFRRIAMRLIPGRMAVKAELLREGIYRYRYKKAHLFWSCIITFFTQLLIIGTAPMTISGITGSWYFLECLAFVPLIEMISMAQPLTPNGIGVRDTLFAVMFKVLHLSNEQLCIYAVISNLSIFVKLIGAVPIIYDFTLKKRGIR